MANFSFPDKCFFCVKHYKSENCLLPYDSVMGLEIPADPSERIMEITMLHTMFHTEHMQYSASVSSYRSQRSESFTDKSHHATVKAIASDTSTQAGAPLPQTEETETNIPDLPAKLPPLASPSLTESSSIREFTTVIKQKSKNAKSSKTSQFVEYHIANCDSTSPNAIEQAHHLSDFSIAVMTAINMRIKKRTNIPLSKFHEALNTEIQTRKDFGKSYSPKLPTPLDHPIALAREIVSNRSHFYDLDKWANLTESKDTNFTGCLLTHPLFINSMNNSSSELRLDNCLLAYARSITLRHPSYTKNAERLNMLTKPSFDERKCSTTAKWIMETSPTELYLKDNKFFLETKSAKSTTLDLQEPKHVCPPLDKQTQTLLSEHLDTLVQQQLHQQGELPFEPNNRTCSGIMTALVTEIAAHSTWRAPTHNVTPGLIKLACKPIDFNLKSSEIVVVALMIENIFNDLREQTKAYK